MLVASSKDAFRKKLVGIGTEIQATDLSEIDHAVVLVRFSPDRRSALRISYSQTGQGSALNGVPRWCLLVLFKTKNHETVFPCLLS